jgi:hypothetical protein
MSFRFVLLTAGGAMLSAASPAFADFTVNFATLIGQSNPLVVPTSDGNTVTFDSPSGPATFFVTDNGGLFRGFDAGLGDSFSFSGDTLTISFANPIEAGVSFPFGIEDAFEANGDDFLTITSNTGVSVVANGTPDGLTLDEPEGNAYIDAPGATQLTITSGIPANSNTYAIGDLTVPEPVTLSILGVGLAGVVAARRRRA